MFVDYADVKKSTIKGYKVHLRHFFIWLSDKKISNPQREDIVEYKEYLEARDFTTGTKRKYFSIVKTFFRWAMNEKLYPNIADNLKGFRVRTDITRKDAFYENDVVRILDSIERDNEMGKRNYAMFLLSITGGLRIIELQRADMKDIKTIAGEKVLMIQGKGRDEKDEYKKLVPEVLEALDDYFDSREKLDGPLFVGTSNRAKNQRITTESLSRIIKSVLVHAGYDSERLTAHSLRHTSITMLLKSGATLQEAQKHARHNDPATTNIYAHNLDRRKDTSEQNIMDQIYVNY